MSEEALSLAKAIYDKQCEYVGGDHEGQCVKMMAYCLDKHLLERDALQARIAEAIEVYAGMDGVTPITHHEVYLMRTLNLMNKALMGG